MLWDTSLVIHFKNVWFLNYHKPWQQESAKKQRVHIYTPGSKGKMTLIDKINKISSWPIEIKLIVIGHHILHKFTQWLFIKDMNGSKVCMSQYTNMSYPFTFSYHKFKPYKFGLYGKQIMEGWDFFKILFLTRGIFNVILCMVL